MFEEYKKYYFKKHPTARIFPFESKPTPLKKDKDTGKKIPRKTQFNPKLFYGVLSLNKLLPIDKRPYDTLKEKWGEFGLWVAKKYGYDNLHISNSMIEMRVFSETLANKDCDNCAGGHKLFGDGCYVDSGMFLDDNYNHINPLLVTCDYDKLKPRTEFRISIFDEDIKDTYEKLKIHIKNWE